jgi:hypothetical protein
MYPMPKQADQNVTTLAADLLADKTGQVLNALQESLTQARQAAQASSGDIGKSKAAQDVSRRLDSAFDVAQRILVSAGAAKTQRT